MLDRTPMISTSALQSCWNKIWFYKCFLGWLEHWLFLYISIHSCTIKCTCTPVSSLNLYNKYRLNSSDRQDLQVEPYLQWGLLGFITFRLQFVPSQSQQSALLQVSLQLASVSPGQISYSEICPCVIWAVCVVCPCVIWNRTRWPKVTAIILSLWSN